MSEFVNQVSTMRLACVRVSEFVNQVSTMRLAFHHGMRAVRSSVVFQPSKC
jgi:hypothetical protein